VEIGTTSIRPSIVIIINDLKPHVQDYYIIMSVTFQKTSEANADRRSVSNLLVNSTFLLVNVLKESR